MFYTKYCFIFIQTNVTFLLPRKYFFIPFFMVTIKKKKVRTKHCWFPFVRVVIIAFLKWFHYHHNNISKWIYDVIICLVSQASSWKRNKKKTNLVKNFFYLDVFIMWLSRCAKLFVHECMLYDYELPLNKSFYEQGS